MDQTRKLDERGWEELAKLLHRTYDEFDRIERESVARIGSDGSKPISAGVVVAFFESVAHAANPDTTPGGAARVGTRKRAKASA
jgi:hypothetical protein